MGWVSAALFGIRKFTQNFYAYPTFDTVEWQGPISFTPDVANNRLIATIGGSGTPATLADLTLPPEPQPAPPAAGWKLYCDQADLRLKAIDSSSRIVILSNPMYVTNSKTFTANNNSARVQVFQLTGAVRILGLYGEVTTVIGANHTASQFGLYDGTTFTAISSPASTALSAAPVGTLAIADGIEVAGTPDNTLVVAPSSAGLVGIHAAGQPIFQPVELVAHAGVTTYIMYAYATTDAPTSGAALFHCKYVPLSANGALVAV